MKTYLINAKIVLENKVIAGTIGIENGQIFLVSAKKPQGLAKENTINLQGRYLLPGFFETHMHGLNNYSCMLGKDNLQEKDAFSEYGNPIPNIMAALPKTGVTSAFLSAFTVPRPSLDRFLVESRRFVDATHPGSARLLGLDLEGNFLKDPKFSGAQDPAHILTPSIALFEELQGLAGGLIKKALVAPEWGETAFALIQHMAKRGLSPSVGHTGCTRDELLRAYDCGTRVVVHTGNGPMSQNFKSGGALDGIFELGPKLYGEIICDLKHVHPRWINTFFNCFSEERVLGVSDAWHYAGAGLPEGTQIRGCLIKDNALWVAGKANTLSGSISTADIQYKNVINLLTSDRKAYFTLKTPSPDTLEAALIKASHLYSLNPAQCFGFDHEIGSIKKGKRADLVVAKVSGKAGNYKLDIDQVFIGGVPASLS